LFAIPRVFRRVEDFFGEVKAKPGTPRPDLRARPAHPAGEVLEMADGISEITAVTGASGFEDPDESAVGRRENFEDRFIRREVSHPGFVELENRLGGFASAPLGLGVTQRVQIELRAFFTAVAAGDGEIEDLPDFGQPRACWIFQTHRQKNSQLGAGRRDSIHDHAKIAWKAAHRIMNPRFARVMRWVSGAASERIPRSIGWVT
jgi:hypothetical protein